MIRQVVLGAACVLSIGVSASGSVSAMAAPAAGPVAVEYSLDGGTTWSAQPPVSWFDPAWRFVPGDAVTRSLDIRSTRAEPTLVQIGLANVIAGSERLDAALTIRGADSSGSGLPATRLSAVQSCEQIVPDRVLVAGETMSIAITMQLSAALDGRSAQDSSSTFDVAVALSDPGTAMAPNGCPIDPTLIPGLTPRSGSSSPAALGYTGSAFVYPSLVVAGLALGIGWLLLAAGRRRSSRHFTGHDDFAWEERAS